MSTYCQLGWLYSKFSKYANEVKTVLVAYCFSSVHILEVQMRRIIGILKMSVEILVLLFWLPGAEW